MDKIRMSQSVADALRTYHLANGKKTESLSFAYGHLIQGVNGEYIVVIANLDCLVFLAEDCFMSKGPGHVTVPIDVRAGVIMEGIRRGYSVLIDIHDHFFAKHAHFSGVDDTDDMRTAKYFMLSLPAFVPKGQTFDSVSLLLAQDDFAGRRVVIMNGKAQFSPMVVDIIGDTFQRFDRSTNEVIDGRFVRHNGMISEHEKKIIASLNIGIVGCGGTGSITVESLLRIGVKRGALIDGDCIEESNLNRLQGAGMRDIGQSKAKFLAERVTSLFPDAKFTPIETEVFSDEAIAALKTFDIILGCIDNNETRWFLNRFSVQYFIPYFDCGVLIETDPQVILHSRVNVIIPGTTRCGNCSDIEFIPRKRPDSFLDSSTLAAQRSAGYVQASTSDTPAPASYSLNQQAVSWMTQEILNFLCGWRNVAHSIYHRGDSDRIERLDRKNYAVGPAEDCSVCSVLLGTCNEHKLPRRGEEVDLVQLIPEGE